MTPPASNLPRKGAICIVGPAQFGQALVSATLAGALAASGQAVMLGELAAQPSEAGALADWLAKRPAAVPRISGWQRVPGANRLKPAAGTQQAVIHLHHDAKAERMAWAVARSRAVVVAVGHGVLQRDLAAIQLEALAARPEAQSGDCKLAVISVGGASDGLAHRRTARWAEHKAGSLFTQANPPATLSYLGNIDDDARYAAWHAAGLQLFDHWEEFHVALLAQWQALLGFADVQADGSQPSLG